MSKRSQFQERLVSLYLRLNGYFQTAYITHSEVKGNNGTELDRIGIRFPYHLQKEVQVDSSSALMIPNDSIDIIIVEVKSNKPEFNNPLKKVESRAIENWGQIYRWIGIIKEDELEDLIKETITLVKLDGKKTKEDKFQIIEYNNEFGKITIRPILFVIDKEYLGTEPKLWIDGKTIISFIWERFCPINDRDSCSTRYPFVLWGTEYEDIVTYFKNRSKEEQERGTLEEMYKYFNL